MRSVFAVLAILAALGVSVAHAGFEVVSYVLSIGSLSLDVGQEGSVDLEVTNIHGAIGVWTIDIVYDPHIVVPVECAPLKNSVCDLRRADNIVRVVGASATGLVADTTLATIKFRCSGAGSSPLSLSPETGTIPELIVEVQTEDGVITCAERPEPTGTETAMTTATPLPQLPATGGGVGPAGRGPNWPMTAMGGLSLALAATFTVLLLVWHRR